MSRLEIHFNAANLAATAEWLEAQTAPTRPIGQGQMTTTQFLMQRVVDVLTDKIVGIAAVEGSAFDAVPLYQRVWGHVAIERYAQYVGNNLQLHPGLSVLNAIERIDDGIDIKREVSLDDGTSGMFLVTATLLCCLR
ncbi:hypothetical protein [Ramlibacter sp.]|uniref:hypothetical protein n=1 Tax=Ramlibacter sp. TaxID=1917967 RepID=UPI002C5CBAA9|nr:hypothetical protein [Ramlibacter sp.]HWI83837.1 hypothetical protein [Ramlibacter sp.]